MNKVSVKGVPFRLIGEAVKIGDTVDFRAKDIDNKIFDIREISGKKIISIFPDINTKVCDMQTHEISKIASENPKVNIISISTDPVDVIKEWCSAKGINNLRIVSDKEMKEFSKSTKLLMKLPHKLARGFLFLDEDNQVIDLAFNEDISKAPDFEKVQEWIKGLK